VKLGRDETSDEPGEGVEAEGKGNVRINGLTEMSQSA
jgi:hypothetical protein